jgi:hypothetical protein
MEVWTAVEAIYQSRTKHIRVDLDRKLQNTKLGSEGDVRAHFMSLTDLRKELSSMGKNYNDDEFALILLGSLPSSYESTISVINAVAYQVNADITPDQVVRLVTTEFDRRQMTKGKNNADKGIAANAQRQRDRRRNAECINCHRLGHFKSDCWAKGVDKEGQRPPRRNDNTDNRNDNRGNGGRNDGAGNRINRNRNSDNRNDDRNDDRNDNANTPADDIGAGAPIDFLNEDRSPSFPQAAHNTAHIHRQPEVEIELYDSSASRHLSPYRHRFTNYRAIPPRAITAPDQRVVYAIGTGDLQINVPNGSATTPILLRDTLYAPEIALTIISISRITRTGSSVTFKDKSCEIKNKSGKVIGTIPVSSNGLYKVEHNHLAESAKTGVEQVGMLEDVATSGI